MGMPFERSAHDTLQHTDLASRFNDRTKIIYIVRPPDFDGSVLRRAVNESAATPLDTGHTHSVAGQYPLDVA
jgi:hypothetical protein